MFSDKAPPSDTSQFEVMVDIISTLSDYILSHILSFLLTEEAVATCVLSKRWRHIWTSVPVLHYDNYYCIDRDNQASLSRFVRFVNASIQARDVNLQHPIRSFRIKFNALDWSGAEAGLSEWLKAVMRPGIEDLVIDLYGTYDLIRLSIFSFRCTTLVSLKLDTLHLDDVSSVELPSLKSLHLSYVEMDSPKCLIDLLLGCPNLEVLYVYMMYYRCYDFAGEFTSLPKLARATLPYINFEFPLKVISNVKYLKITKV